MAPLRGAGASARDGPGIPAWGISKPGRFLLRHGGERTIEDGLAAGLWVVRLRSPFAPKLFPSADSAALRAAARSELDRLLSQQATR